MQRQPWTPSGVLSLFTPAVELIRETVSTVRQWLKQFFCGLRLHTGIAFTAFEDGCLVLRCTRCGAFQPYTQQKVLISTETREMLKERDLFLFRYSEESCVPMRARSILLLDKRAPLRVFFG